MRYLFHPWGVGLAALLLLIVFIALLNRDDSNPAPGTGDVPFEVELEGDLPSNLLIRVNDFAIRIRARAEPTETAPEQVPERSPTPAASGDTPESTGR